MANSEGAEEVAILLQETVEELKQQRELNLQLKAMMEKNSQQLAEVNSRCDESRTCRRRNKATPVVVSLQTRVSHIDYKNYYV